MTEWACPVPAARLCVSRQTVISIERDRFDPSLLLACAIAATFGCTIEDNSIPDDPA